MQCTVCTRYILPSERTPCCADLIRPVRLEKTPVSSSFTKRLVLASKVKINKRGNKGAAAEYYMRN